MQQNDPFHSNQRRVLNLQEKWFSFRKTLNIVDEQGRNAYTAEGQFFHLGLDMLLKDSNQGTVLCEIKSRILTLMAEYDFYQNVYFLT